MFGGDGAGNRTASPEEHRGANWGGAEERAGGTGGGQRGEAEDEAAGTGGEEAEAGFGGAGGAFFLFICFWNISTK